MEVSGSTDRPHCTKCGAYLDRDPDNAYGWCGACQAWAQMGGMRPVPAAPLTPLPADPVVPTWTPPWGYHPFTHVEVSPIRPAPYGWEVTCGVPGGVIPTQTTVSAEQTAPYPPSQWVYTWPTDLPLVEGTSAATLHALGLTR